MESFYYFLPLLWWSVFYRTNAFPTFQARIPNGARVPHPCSRNERTWEGVGHELATGPGPLNPFGRDFLTNGKKWDRTICMFDSDGDGMTNGQELGDPACNWTLGEAPAIDKLDQLSHPGICEPVNSPNCKPRNKFLENVAECSELLGKPKEDWCPEIKSRNVKNISLTFTPTDLPPLGTLYYCQQFDIPNDEEYHIIAWEPIISNREIMHHLILYTCDTDQQLENLKNSNKYTRPGECPMMPEECYGGVIGWAFGVGNRCYNSETGVPMGKGHFKKAILQIHYNNPNLRSDFRDASGIRIYYTNVLRRYEVGSLEVGQTDIVIPPRSMKLTRIVGKAFQSTGCSVRTLAPYQSYNITSMLFHMHKLGVHAKVLLKRRNGLQQVLRMFLRFIIIIKVFMLFHFCFCSSR